MNKPLYYGEVADTSLELSYNGMTQTVPLVGAFYVDGKTYAVVCVSEHGKQEYVMYNVYQDENNEEHIRVITSKDEWEKAYNTWCSLLEQARS